MGTQIFLKHGRGWPGTSETFEGIMLVGCLVRCHRGADGNEQPSITGMASSLGDAWADYAHFKDDVLAKSSDGALSVPEIMKYFGVKLRTSLFPGPNSSPYLPIRYVVGKYGEELGPRNIFYRILTGVAHSAGLMFSCLFKSKKIFKN